MYPTLGEDILVPPDRRPGRPEILLLRSICIRIRRLRHAFGLEERPQTVNPEGIFNHSLHKSVKKIREVRAFLFPACISHGILQGGDAGTIDS